MERNFKSVSISDKAVEQDFKENVYCYFGPDRYEKPQWMGSKYYENSVSKLEQYEHINIRKKVSGYLNNPITVRNVNSDTLQWLLDVIVDSRVDCIPVTDTGFSIERTNVNILRQLYTARDNVEKIMSEILGKEIYFGLNYRSSQGSRFNIIQKDNNQILIPTLDGLSTGQSALFNMFATIIRYADNNDINKSIKIQDISGIVIIDEIDLHLHSNLQREVLPRLIRLFPKIQFIITTHSPLFLLGMEEQFGEDGYRIIEMPTGDVITAEAFSEFQRAYEYLAKTNKHKQAIKNAIAENTEKTLIITEGATDWKHMKAALNELRISAGEYEGLDFNFLEYEPDDDKKKEDGILRLKMSCTELSTMCETMAKIKQPRKIIFVADADEQNTKKKLEGVEMPYKSWGNNVYSFVLPIPEHRSKTPQICIEHYYTDNEIMTPIMSNGSERRLYMGFEFNEHGLSNDKNLFCVDRNSCGPGKIRIIDRQSNKEVYRIHDDSQQNITLSKMEFANAILGKDEAVAAFDFTNFKLIFDIIKQIEEQ